MYAQSKGVRVPENTQCFCDFTIMFVHLHVGRRGGLIVSALESGSVGPGSSRGRGHCIVFLGKTLYSHCTSLYRGV